MKVYLLEQNAVVGYDTYDSAVVAATSSKEARNIHPMGYNVKDEDTWETDCWCTPSKVKVTYLGKAKNTLKKGMICTSFNAG